MLENGLVRAAINLHTAMANTFLIYGQRLPGELITRYAVEQDVQPILAAATTRQSRSSPKASSGVSRFSLDETDRLDLAPNRSTRSFTAGHSADFKADGRGMP